MDNNVTFSDSEGPVAQVQSQNHSSASDLYSKKSSNTKIDVSAENNNCNLTIMPSSEKLSDDGISAVSQVTAHLKDKMTLKSSSGVNGIVNGLAINVELPSHTSDFKHKSLSNGKATNIECPSHCENCETSSFPSGITSDSKSSNCILNQSKDADCISKLDKCNEISASIDSALGTDEITYVSYKSELQMPDIMRLIQKDLSEPYSIYTYRYFIHNWPKLCFLAMHGNDCVGAIVCKLDLHRKVVKRGYIAMLAVDEKYRKRKIGSNLVLKAIRAMVEDDADEVVLETEITNRPALRLYENLGFVRDKRLFRYYLNGVDALRLKLWLR